MHSLVRGFLLSWHGFSVGKKKKNNLGRLLHYACSRPYGVGEIGELSIPVKVLIKQLRDLS